MRLHSRIFALVIFTLLGLASTNVIFFYISARDKVTVDVTERLLLAERSFVDLLENREKQLTGSVHAVVNDWGLRQAIGQQDRQTVTDVLVNHSTRIDADVALFIGRDREVFASTLGSIQLPAKVTGLLDQAPTGATLMARLDDRYYQLVLEEVKAPLQLGWLAMGFLINDDLAEKLSRLSDVEVSFLHDVRGKYDVFASSMAHSTRALAGADDGPGNLPDVWTVNGPDFEDLVLHHNLDSDEPGIRVALQRSLREPLDAFRSWWWSLLTIFTLATLVVLGLAWAFSRGITRPLNLLLSAIKDMEVGDYSTAIEVRRNDEIGSLSESFTRMQRAIAVREDEIRHRADHDLTTGVFNRNGFLDVLDGQIATAEAASSAVAVVCLRIRHFQQIVDALGHDWGDKLLKMVAERLTSTFTGCGLAHVNTDEFFMNFATQNVSTLFSIGERVHDCLNAEFLIRGISLTLSANLGISVFPDHAADGQNMLRKASVALNEAIERHQRTVVYDPELDQNSVKRLTLMSELPRAIKDGQLELYYQPKLRLANGRSTVEAVECLVRWQHPELGIVPPDDFISLAEKTGYIVELSQFVLDRAIYQCSEWRRRGLGLAVSVNISAVDLSQGSLADRVLPLLEHHGLPAGSLCLEITESAAMEDPDSAMEKLTALKDLGVRLSIDDYGTGYSSLAQLKKLPVHELKIDKSFVLELDRSEDDQTIVRSTIELAHNIGLEVVAEGVESDRILWQLAQWQADWGQGFHISRPLPLDQLEAWLDTTEYAVRPVLASIKPDDATVRTSAI